MRIFVAPRVSPRTFRRAWGSRVVRFRFHRRNVSLTQVLGETRSPQLPLQLTPARGLAGRLPLGEGPRRGSLASGQDRAATSAASSSAGEGRGPSPVGLNTHRRAGQRLCAVRPANGSGSQGLPGRVRSSLRRVQVALRSSAVFTAEGPGGSAAVSAVSAGPPVASPPRRRKNS